MAISWTGTTFQGTPCHIGDGPWGTLDYRDPSNRRELQNVELHHFDVNVEKLRGGRSGTAIADIGYTLRAFPNHHRALKSMAYWGWQNRGKNNDKRISPECYFQHAVELFPDDYTALKIYGVYLHKAGKLNQALIQYKSAERIIPNSSELQYNIGLVNFALNDYPKALEYARKAYKNGYPLPGLRNKLKQAGEWKAD